MKIRLLQENTPELKTRNINPKNISKSFYKKNKDIIRVGNIIEYIETSRDRQFIYTERINEINEMEGFVILDLNNITSNIQEIKQWKRLRQTISIFPVYLEIMQPKNKPKRPAKRPI